MGNYDEVDEGLDDYNDDDYNDEYNEYNEYEQEDAFDDDEYDEYDELTDQDTKIVNNVENNAWVWQLLILSFSLGVCSCLCYYATKVKPSNGKMGQYDFRHQQRGKYSKVQFESGHSAYDHDDIIDQQLD